MLTPELIRSALEKAMTEEIGICLKVHNPKQAQFKFDEWRKANEPFAGLVIAIPSIPDHIFIVKKSVELAP